MNIVNALAETREAAVAIELAAAQNKVPTVFAR